MVIIKYKNIFPENNEKTQLSVGKGVLTSSQYIYRYSEEIKNRLDFCDLKNDFELIFDKLVNNKIFTLSKIFNLINGSKDVNILNIFPNKNKNFEDYNILDIENLIYKVGEEKFIDDHLIYDLYNDYLGYKTLIKESKDSLFKSTFYEIEKYVFNESGILLDDLEKDELVGEIIDDIEDKFDDINLSDKYLFEKVYKIIEEIKLDFLTAGNLFKSLKGEKIQELDNLQSIGIDYEKVNSNDLSYEEKKKLLKDLMELYYKNYNEKNQKDFLYEIKFKLGNMIFNNNINDVFYIFKIDGELTLSLYFEEIDQDTFYMGGFNSNNLFFEYGFGFWALDKILEEKKDKIIKAGVLTKVDGFKKWGYERMLKKYIEDPFFFKIGKTVKFGDNEYIEIIKYPNSID